MRLTFVDKGKEFCDVLRWQFRSHPEIEVVCGRFEDLPTFDCVVTAGNSFGLMDAGMDLAVVRYFGRQVMDIIQKQILDDYLGEQPVGSCIIVPTGHPTHPFVAHAPTMRVPMNIKGTDHIYLALWATLTAVHRHNRSQSRKIDSVACPGLGTGTGGWMLSRRRSSCFWLMSIFAVRHSLSIRRWPKSATRRYIMAAIGDSPTREQKVLNKSRHDRIRSRTF